MGSRMEMYAVACLLVVVGLGLLRWIAWLRKGDEEEI